jgi:hypothetical protein
VRLPDRDSRATRCERVSQRAVELRGPYREWLDALADVIRQTGVDAHAADERGTIVAFVTNGGRDARRGRTARLVPPPAFGLLCDRSRDAARPALTR